ncbi:hypothetical protein DdX_13089 [Ditylenchus destructor]|uniref:Uncharacterized protein n=1 Tax=Ditylenchus destructor TaxID=166010 RepID=A0AAD4R2V4_9BILA|nr:hypothetical protein DdX_13089 [Ditylenchus destructor]
MKPVPFVFPHRDEAIDVSLAQIRAEREKLTHVTLPTSILRNSTFVDLYKAMVEQKLLPRNWSVYWNVYIKAPHSTPANKVREIRKGKENNKFEKKSYIEKIGKANVAKTEDGRITVLLEAETMEP